MRNNHIERTKTQLLPAAVRKQFQSCMSLHIIDCKCRNWDEWFDQLSQSCKLQRLKIESYIDFDVDVAQMSSLKSFSILPSIYGLTILTQQMISKMKNIKELEIPFQRLPLNALSHIAKLPQLTSLDLSNNELTAEGCHVVGRMKQLTKLAANQNMLGSDNVRNLTRMTSQITHLGLRLNALADDAVISILRNCAKLTWLDLSHNMIGSEGMHRLSRKKLKLLMNNNLVDVIIMRGVQFVTLGSQDEMQRITHFQGGSQNN